MNLISDLLGKLSVLVCVCEMHTDSYLTEETVPVVMESVLEKLDFM